MKYHLRNILILLIMSACSSQEIDTSHSFQIYEENGVTIAENRGEPKYTGDLFTFTPHVILLEDERPESLLNQPYQFLIDSEGYYYVNDRGDARIAVFNPDGRYERSIGRDGDGPGEFRSPYIEYVRDNIIEVSDIGLRRVTRFQTDGTLIDMLTLSGKQIDRPSRIFHIADDRLIKIFSKYENSEEKRYRWIEVLIQTTAFDTLSHLLTDRVLTGYLYTREFMGRSGQTTSYYMFAPNPMADYDPSLGIVLSSGDKPVLDLFDDSGRRFKQIQMDIEPSEVTATDREKVIEIIQSSLYEADENTREATRLMLERLQFLEHKPPWFGFTLDDNGYFWIFDVSAYAMESIIELGMDIMLLSPEGEYLGRTHLPPLMYMKITGNRLLAIAEDSASGAIQLTAYEIRPAIEGFKYP